MVKSFGCIVHATIWRCTCVWKTITKDSRGEMQFAFRILQGSMRYAIFQNIVLTSRFGAGLPYVG